MASTSKAEGRSLLPAHVEPYHYELKITPNLESDFIYKGNVVVSLELHDSTNTITLHAKDLKLTTCRFQPEDDSDNVQSPTDISYDSKATTVSLKFNRPLEKGKGLLAIEFTGVHNNQMAGFYRSEYEDIKKSKKMMVSTQFEAIDARKCFPCVDEPQRKATFKCELTVAKELIALSNMPIESTIDTANGLKTVKFMTTPRMSTYLLAFCVGEFDFVEGMTEHSVKIRVYTPPGKKNLGEFALDVGKKSLDLYDDMFGQPYPLPKLDMIAIPEFAMGAMENWGLVTYREVDVLIDPIRAPSWQKQRVSTVVAHELAHQWFGNLVTMAWWDDLWLNEGFASWMQTYATDYMFPEWSMWEQFVINEQAGALKLDAMRSSHPIQVPINHAEEVEQVFDAISYFKGACIVRLLHAYLGHNDFVTGLQVYMDRHKYKNTETYDLWNAWAEVSGKPILEVMSSWTEQMGYPIVTVESYHRNTLSLRQEWFLSDGSKATDEETKLWKIPLFIATQSGEEYIGLFEKASQDFHIKGEPKFLKVNGGQHCPFIVAYTSEMFDHLIDAIKLGELSPKDRAGLLVDGYSLTKSGNLSPELFINLLSAYKNEESLPVWEAIKQALYGLNGLLLENQALHNRFKAFITQLIQPTFENIGWDAKPTDGHQGKLLRALLLDLQVLGMQTDEVIDEARRRFALYISDPTNPDMELILPSDYKKAVFRIVLLNTAQRRPYDQLMEVLEKVETPAEKKDVYLSLGYINNDELRKEALDWCTSVLGKVKYQDFFYPIGSVSSSGLNGLNLTWAYLQENFSRIREMIKDASPSLLAAVIAYSCSGYTSEEKADEIEQFFKEQNVESVTRKVSQIVENTRANSKFLNYVLNSQGFADTLV